MNTLQPNGLYYPSDPWLRKALKTEEANNLLHAAEDLLREVSEDDTIAMLVDVFDGIVVDVDKLQTAQDSLDEAKLELDKCRELVAYIYEVCTGKEKVKGSKLDRIFEEIEDAIQVRDIDISCQLEAKSA